MNFESQYWSFVLENHPENYVSKDNMIRNWEEGRFFDEFAKSLGITEDELLEKI